MFQTIRKYTLNVIRNNYNGGCQFRSICAGKFCANSVNTEINTSQVNPETSKETKAPKPAPDDYVKTEKHGAITIISLNRPAKRNAINNEMALKICDAITSFENDDTSSVGVLYGVGGSFSSGYDLNELGTENLRPEEVLLHSEGSVVSEIKYR